MCVWPNHSSQQGQPRDLSWDLRRGDTLSDQVVILKCQKPLRGIILLRKEPSDSSLVPIEFTLLRKAQEASGRVRQNLQSKTNLQFADSCVCYLLIFTWQEGTSEASKSL